MGKDIGVNAVENNLLYINKSSNEVVAFDGENDHQIALINEDEAKNLESQLLLKSAKEIFESEKEDLTQSDIELLGSIYQKLNLKDKTELESKLNLLQLDSSYKTKTKGDLYDLTDKGDFNYLASLTGKEGVTYSSEVSDILFSKNNQSDDKKK